MKEHKKHIYRKRKKEPFIILSILILISVMALIPLVYSLLKTQGRDEQSIFSEEQEQLSEMSSYLDEIAGIVAINREQLAEATVSRTETTQTLETCFESMNGLEKDLDRVEAVIGKGRKDQATENTRLVESFSALSRKQEELRSKIEAINTCISDILSNVQKEYSDSFVTTFDKLERLQSEISRIQTDVKAYTDDLNGTISLLRKENDSQYREMAESLSAVYDDLSTLMAGNFTSLLSQLSKDFTSLMERLNTLHKQITDAESSISDLLTLIEKK